MAEWLIQRFVPNLPNAEGGAWVDEGTSGELKASEAQQAVDSLADPSYPVSVRRAIRWDTTEEFETVPGPPKTSKATKRARTPEVP